MRIFRPWLVALLPGMLIAGLILGLGPRDFGLGVLCGVVLTVFSQAILSLCVSGITSSGSCKRTVLLAGAHFGKYLLVAIVFYGAVRHPQIDSIGMFLGITLGVGGFVVSQMVANPVAKPPPQDVH
jgi:hypothetical protein